MVETPLRVTKRQALDRGQHRWSLCDDEVTVKRFQKGDQPHAVALLPENRDYQPIEVDLRTCDFAIEGLAVGVIRH